MHAPNAALSTPPHPRGDGIVLAADDAEPAVQIQASLFVGAEGMHYINPRRLRDEDD
jgi:hypothetical protein